ncbi:hypothetical protein IQ264_28765 [Phormidium sp. LEGE 05292]|uniref:hypothetical protein n=1 Tax=[Phormidium] sp. LEGE 05292 TaxID=767427 RepID=UPI00187FB2FB|nr:hypothetical protein [Phormidium sp. LEGE 05292]MBE9229402.1 hypothetical protein [Phormidium sp. LEGE 05292]
MNQTYPVILYPEKILKFLAQNSTGRTHQLQPIQEPPIKSVPPPRRKTYLYLLLFLVSVLMAVSFTFLSPFWLVVMAWLVILFGMFGVMFPHLPTTKKHHHKQITDAQQVPQLSSPDREHQLSVLLADSVITSIGVGNAQVGVSEKAFQQILQQFFPNIVPGLQFKNPVLDFPYSVDFALFHKSGLSIDIEIDEPYVGNTKEPSHCIDSTKDDIRNKFFTAGNWVVVRFSEKQVVQYPQSCCQVIASIIARVTGDYTYLTQLENLPKLPSDLMWTTRQAKKWAKQNYRQTYLP